MQDLVIARLQEYPENVLVVTGASITGGSENISYNAPQLAIEMRQQLPLQSPRASERRDRAQDVVLKSVTEPLGDACKVVGISE